MTRKTLTFALLALLALTAHAQNGDEAKRVLRQSREACLAVQRGHYVMENRHKYMSSNDTSMLRQTCDFAMLPDDTLFGKRFAILEEPLDTSVWSFKALYTGNELVHYDDSTATVTSCAQWADLIKNIRHNYDFYTPLTTQNAYPVPTDKELADSSNTFSLTESYLEGKPCWHFTMYNEPNVEPLPGLKVIRYEVGLWIDLQSYIPVQYTVTYTQVEGQDTMVQYDECRLVEFTPHVDERRLTMESLPSGLTHTEYTPYEPPEPLATGTLAPDWALPTLGGDTVHLADLRGRVVLLDFFYKSCGPCCAAMPGLQSLHEKYKDRGLVVVGIDPMDNPMKDQMADFLAKRGLTYTVLFADRRLPEAYHVYAYPTIFIIDRKGNIAETRIGFSKEQEADIEELITKML